jgi:hypothetical protein
MYVNGRCHCGAIRLEADIHPKRVVICHCTDCQRHLDAYAKRRSPWRCIRGSRCQIAAMN